MQNACNLKKCLTFRSCWWQINYDRGNEETFVTSRAAMSKISLNFHTFKCFFFKTKYKSHRDTIILSVYLCYLGEIIRMKLYLPSKLWRNSLPDKPLHWKNNKIMASSFPYLLQTAVFNVSISVSQHKSFQYLIFKLIMKLKEEIRKSCSIFLWRSKALLFCT